jgi:hypothetical protein
MTSIMKTVQGSNYYHIGCNRNDPSCIVPDLSTTYLLMGPIRRFYSNRDNFSLLALTKDDKVADNLNVRKNGGVVWLIGQD